MVEPFAKLCNTRVQIVCLEAFINDNRVSFIVHRIKVETLRGTVVLVEGMSKDLRLFAGVLKERSPKPFHLLSFQSADLILIVKPCKEPGIESHLCEKSRGSI